MNIRKREHITLVLLLKNIKKLCSAPSSFAAEFGYISRQCFEGNVAPTLFKALIKPKKNSIKSENAKGLP